MPSLSSSFLPSLSSMLSTAPVLLRCHGVTVPAGIVSAFLKDTGIRSFSASANPAVEPAYTGEQVRRCPQGPPRGMGLYVPFAWLCLSHSL